MNMVSLILVSSGDIASTNQADELLKMCEWQELDPVEGLPSYSFKHARMWWMKDGCLWEDDLDKRWAEATGEIPTEIIFPSRHSAASGNASLTLHPIGTMQVPEGETPEYGGKAADCPPPNPRIAAWWRELNRVANDLTEFDLTLETTHHGPWIETPSLFIEIGSTDLTWGHMGAAKILAGIIYRGLGLDGGNGLGQWNGNGRVVVTLGGGHYAPRGNLLASHEGIWLGHARGSSEAWNKRGPGKKARVEDGTGKLTNPIRTAPVSLPVHASPEREPRMLNTRMEPFIPVEAHHCRHCRAHWLHVAPPP